MKIRQISPERRKELREKLKNGEIKICRTEEEKKRNQKNTQKK